jgi:ribonuclease HI
MANYVIVFDGGSRNNGSRDAEGYGSYQISVPSTRQSCIVRLTFSTGTTNNEAEYKALIAALKDLKGRIEQARRRPQNYTVEVRGDSQLVIEQVSGAWKCKKANLLPLRDAVRNFADLFKEVEFVWQPREKSVEVLGH